MGSAREIHKPIHILDAAHLLLNVTCPKTCRYDCISLTLCGLICGDVILVSIVLLYFSAAILCITMYLVFFSLSFSFC